MRSFRKRKAIVTLMAGCAVMGVLLAMMRTYVKHQRRGMQ